MSRLTVWNPFRRQEWGYPTTWNDMMDRFFAPAMMEGNGEDRWFPRMDVRETPESYVFTCETPGLRAEDINVALSGDVLTISGERKKEEKREKDQWHVTERSYGSFTRTFSFPTAVESEGVDAEMKDGILTVKVMKSKKVLPRKISVHPAK